MVPDVAIRILADLVNTYGCTVPGAACLYHIKV